MECNLEQMALALCRDLSSGAYICLYTQINLLSHLKPAILQILMDHMHLGSTFHRHHPLHHHLFSYLMKVFEEAVIMAFIVFTIIM